MSVTDTRILAGEQRMLIDGELQLADGDAKFNVEHPGSGHVVGQATDATVADMKRAVGAAWRAFENTNWAMARAGRLLLQRHVLQRRTPRPPYVGQLP
jgi:aldehyde dehydrogenase (NAD+)